MLQKWAAATTTTSHEVWKWLLARKKVHHHWCIIVCVWVGEDHLSSQGLNKGGLSEDRFTVSLRISLWSDRHVYLAQGRASVSCMDRFCSRMLRGQEYSCPCATGISLDLILLSRNNAFPSWSSERILSSAALVNVASFIELSSSLLPKA